MGIERKAEKSKWERAEIKPTIHCRTKCNNVNDFQPMSSVPCEMNKPIHYLENWEWLNSWCMVKFHIFCEQPHAHAIKAKHCCWHAPVKRDRSSKQFALHAIKAGWSSVSSKHLMFLKTTVKMCKMKMQHIAAHPFWTNKENLLWHGPCFSVSPRGSSSELGSYMLEIGFGAGSPVLLEACSVNTHTGAQLWTTNHNQLSWII